ncbi:hypothetical protein [Methanomethylovorans sp.]|uniref:hypothetical protein n=1 Tax=Methanomethylovorans sp. TaxID=2758717 RepID=UPI00351CA390
MTPRIPVLGEQGFVGSPRSDIANHLDRGMRRGIISLREMTYCREMRSLGLYMINYD